MYQSASCCLSRGGGVSIFFSREKSHRIHRSTRQLDGRAFVQSPETNWRDLRRVCATYLEDAISKVFAAHARHWSSIAPPISRERTRAKLQVVIEHRSICPRWRRMCFCAGICESAADSYLFVERERWGILLKFAGYRDAGWRSWCSMYDYPCERNPRRDYTEIRGILHVGRERTRLDSAVCRGF